MEGRHHHCPDFHRWPLRARLCARKARRLRTRELKEAWKKQQETECEAREASARLESLQRAGAVGQISSIVAHEMKQPLGVIQNLSRGTLRLIEDEPETLDEVAQAVESINDEAVRAAQIIDRVRSWSQGRVNRQVLEADQGVKRAVQSFMLTNRSRGISIRTGRASIGKGLDGSA